MVTMIVRGLDEFVEKIRQIPNRMSFAQRVFLNNGEKKYTQAARAIVKKVVYDVYKPYIYQRTYRLLRSAFAKALPNGLTIFTDPSMTMGITYYSAMWGEWRGKPLRWKNTSSTYSIDVHEGLGSVGAIMRRAGIGESGARRWLPVWTAHFNVRIPMEYNKKVVRRTLQRIFR